MKKSVFFLILAFNIYLVSYSQTNVLEINGMVETIDGNPLSGAVAELYENNSKIKSNTTGSDGMFSFTLSYGKSYRIVVSKSGMIHKQIDFNTNIPAESQRKLIKEFAMSLVQDCEGANTQVFDEPVDMVEYDQGFGNFVSNRAYFEKMQARISAAYQDIEKCKQDKYEENKKAADQAMKEGKFEEAKKSYEQALQVFPNDSYAKRQIGQANKGISQQSQTETKYNQIIKEADQFLSQNQLTAAKARYAEASKLKSGEAYPQQKIKEIDGSLAQQAQQAQQQQALNTQFNDLVAKANAAMATKNYPMAQQLFEQAAKLKPNDPFPAQKIAEAQQAIQKQEKAKIDQANNEKSYQDLIAQAQEAMQKGDYQKAQQLFQNALVIKPNETLPRQSINEAQRLDALKKQQTLNQQKAEVDRKFNEAIQKADGLLAQKEYQNALNAYKEAMLIKPSDEYAQAQVKKAQNLMVEEQQKQKVALEQSYNQALALGDSKKLNKEYEAAISAYQQALVAKPTDAIAQNKLAEAQKLLANQQAQLKEETEKKAQYRQLVQEGDGFIKSQQLSEAKQKYQQALALYPAEIYPKNQIASIDNTLAKNQKEVEYNKIITQADQLLAQKNYENAKTQYALAMQMLPEKNYPLQKINEINKLIGDKAKLEIQEKYNQFATQAEQQISQKNFEQAKTLYSQAQLVMPENPYPKQRINEINSMIDEQAKNSREAKYNQYITQADGLFNSKNYDQAKSIYSQAQREFPEKTYPQNKINEINRLVSDQSRKKVEDEYNTIVSEADKLFAQKSFAQAITAYQQAMKVIPENPYPQQKINEISSLQAEMARIEQEKLDKKGSYDKTVTLADKHFNDKNYILARTEYNNALIIYPSEQYPKSQIDKIEQQLSLIQQEDSKRRDIDQRFNSAMLQADELFKNKQYNDAKSFYKQANELKPTDVHSSSQIQRIDEILAQLALEQKSIEEKDNRYKEIISNADSKFNSNNYKEARILYAQSLEVKPNELYPREQIKKIDDNIKALAKTTAKTTTTVSTTSTSNEVSSSSKGSSKIADLAFKTVNEREKYFEGLKKQYTEGVTLEIYKEGNKTTKRYIVIRSNEVHEFREVFFTWGGGQSSVDGKPTNSMYLQSQVKPRTGENFSEKEM